MKKSPDSREPLIIQEIFYSAVKTPIGWIRPKNYTPELMQALTRLPLTTWFHLVRMR